jgi:hypothetical protein
MKTFASKKSSEEFRAFSGMVDKVLSVPHAEIKKKLEEEKAAKKRKKAKQSSASDRAASGRT